MANENNTFEHQKVNEISGQAPVIVKQNSKFYNFFTSLSEEEQNFETFFHFNKKQLAQIISAYYEDLQMSFGSNQENILQYILNFFYTNLQNDIDLNLSFEGTEIGIKEESFKFSITKTEREEKKEVSVIKITQNFDSDYVMQNIQSSDNQKFSTYIEQEDKVIEVSQAIRKKINDNMGETVVQLTAMFFILCDIIAQSKHIRHMYELQTNQGTLKIDLEQKCQAFNLIGNISLAPKFKN